MIASSGLALGLSSFVFRVIFSKKSATFWSCLSLIFGFRPKAAYILAALRLLLASARMHTRPLREDEDESDNDRCENA